MARTTMMKDSRMPGLTPQRLHPLKAKPEGGDPEGMDLQQKFADARQAMHASMIEHDDEADLVLTALIAGENLLLVGPPGTGKSLLIDNVMRWMNAAKFDVLLNKFTTPEEVCGPVSVQGLKADEYRRLTTGMLPEAEVAFLDEIFKASSAILNTMLKILNEHTFKNGTAGTVKCPLRLCLAASNEWPSDENGGKELGALFDRFLFRKTVRTVSPNAGRKALLKRAVDNDPCKAVFTSSITPVEVDQANAEAKVLPWSDEAKTALWEILKELNAEGVCPGDRRQYKAINAARAYAYLSGAAEVKPEHLEVLSHVLWDDPTEQPEKCAKVVARIANPVGMRVNELLMQVEDVLAKETAATKTALSLEDIAKQLKALPSDPRRDKAIAYVGEQHREALNRVVRVGS